jgi:hypothetical protein
MTYPEEHEVRDGRVKGLVFLAEVLGGDPFETFKRFMVGRQLHSSGS